MKIGHKKYAAVIIGIAIVLLLWTANLFSFFKNANGYSYDMLMRSYLATDASDEMILIELEKEYSAKGDEVWLTLIEQLLQNDTKLIAFNLMPEQASEKFYQLAIDSGKTVFALQRVEEIESSEKLLQMLPPAAKSKKLDFGLVDTAPSQHGVSRQQHSILEASGIQFSAFEKKVAEQVFKETGDLPSGNFFVNFSGGEARIPILGIQRVLSGGLVNELVKGRVVLVGVRGQEGMERYFTPIVSDISLTSDVMYRAFSLDTLLSDRVITPISSWIILLLLILITVASLFLCQWLSFQMSLTISFAATLIYCMVCWIALQFFFIWIPFIELFLAQWLCFALVWRNRVTQENKQLDQMILAVSLKLREKINPVSIYQSEEPWEQLISMINQTLNINRLIFLERVVGDHRLSEITALNCSIDDIKEMRRDYERTPYSTAISENKPILLDRPYLVETNEVEQQYLAPLIFAGEVLGFWAFTIETEKIQSKLKFNALTYDFMVQISEILHYRQEWQKRMHLEENKFMSYLRFEGGAEHLQNLNQSVTLIDRRISELQEVFNNIKTSCILYDLFGRLLLVNKYMEDFALEVDLRLFNLTMLDFIVEISGYDEAKSRNLLQQVVFDHELVSIPVTNTKLKRNFMLNIKPLRYQEHKGEEELIPDESNILQNSGVLIELIDMTDLKSLYQLKEKMFEHFSFQVRNDLSSILFALPMLEDEETSKGDKQFALENIQGKVDETLSMLDMVKEQMDVDIENILSHGVRPYNLHCSQF